MIATRVFCLVSKTLLVGGRIRPCLSLQDYCLASKTTTQKHGLPEFCSGLTVLGLHNVFKLYCHENRLSKLWREKKILLYFLFYSILFLFWQCLCQRQIDTCYFLFSCSSFRGVDATPPGNTKAV